MKITRKKETLALQVLATNLMTVGHEVKKWTEGTGYVFRRAVLDLSSDNKEDFALGFNHGYLTGKWGDYIVCEPTKVDIYTAEGYDKLFCEGEK